MPPYPDYPFTSRRLDLGGFNLHYLDEGPPDAPPILMLHGNPTWSFFFRRLISALRGEHRVIVPDHIGMGLCDKPPESQYPYTLARRVQDIETLVDHLQLRQSLTLVLHDWGGMIGMALATRRPAGIARIIAMNTGAFRLPSAKKMPWQLSLARTPLLGALLVRGFNAFSRGAVRDCVMQKMPDDVRRAYLAPYDSWAHRLAVHRFIQDIPLRPSDRAWSTVAETENQLPLLRHVPTLLCWGMEDFVFDHHFLARWIDFFPQAQVHRFPDAGHYVLEDAHAEIIPLVQQFLAAHPAEAPIA